MGSAEHHTPGKGWADWEMWRRGGGTMGSAEARAGVVPARGGKVHRCLQLLKKLRKKVISCSLRPARDRLQSDALKFCSKEGVGWEKYSECKKTSLCLGEGWRCPSPEGLEKRLGRSPPGLGGDRRCPATAPICLKNGVSSVWAGWRSCGQGSWVWSQARCDCPLNGQGWQRAGNIFLSEYPLIN